MRMRTIGKLKLLVLVVVAGITGPDVNICSVCILASVHIETLVVSTGPFDHSSACCSHNATVQCYCSNNFFLLFEPFNTAQSFSKLYLIFKWQTYWPPDTIIDVEIPVIASVHWWLATCPAIKFWMICVTWRPFGVHSRHVKHHSSIPAPSFGHVARTCGTCGTA